MMVRSGCWLAGVAALVAAASSGCSRPAGAQPQVDAARVKELRAALGAGASSTEAAAADTGSAVANGWATLRGVFKFAGTAPTPGKIRVDKDVEVCGKHELLDERLIVGPAGGLEGAVIFLRTSKLPIHPGYESSAAEPVVVDNKNCRFEPHIQVLRTTQTLVLKNSDPVGHNSNVNGANFSVNVSIAANESSKQQVSKEEQQPMKIGCSIHPWMGGWIVVRQDPYAAVSNVSGEFVLANLPAGVELEFQLWHEMPKFLKGAQIKDAKVDTKGRFKLKLQPDEERALEITVPAAALSG